MAAIVEVAGLVVLIVVPVGADKNCPPDVGLVTVVAEKEEEGDGAAAAADDNDVFDTIVNIPPGGLLVAVVVVEVVVATAEEEKLDASVNNPPGLLVVLETVAEVITSFEVAVIAVVKEDTGLAAANIEEDDEVTEVNDAIGLASGAEAFKFALESLRIVLGFAVAIVAVGTTVAVTDLERGAAISILFELLLFLILSSSDNLADLCGGAD